MVPIMLPEERVQQLVPDGRRSLSVRATPDPHRTEFTVHDKAFQGTRREMVNGM
jgi:hypothetical protein